MITDGIDILEWKKFLQERVRSRNYLKAYIDYIQNLASQNLPIIFELEHLSELVGIEKDILTRMVVHSSSFYRNFEIPKRKGGTRIISTPFPSLMHVQRWISCNILQNISIHSCAHGFVKERSVVTNAQQHLNKNYLLKMDISDFFPSIEIRRIIEIFKRCGYATNVNYFLASLCCQRNKLPQGAATSPVLSNIVFKRIDRRLAGLSAKWGISYTRYADDLTFSGDFIPLKYSSYVASIIESEGFKVNDKKTILIRGGGRKIVTGISVAGSELTLPKETRRKLRQEAFFLQKNGFFEHTKRINFFDPLYAERLLGKFNFWKQVEPDNTYIDRVISTIKETQKKLDLLTE